MKIASSMKRSSNRTAVTMLVGAALVLAAACSSGGKPAATTTQTLSSKQLAAALAKPTTITWWTWLPQANKEAALFEKKYPKITVKVQNVGQGAPEYTKLRNVLQAGKGAPDAVQIEYQYIPTFTITNDLLNLAPYGANKLKDKFVPWTWAQVSDGDKVFAIPQDSGPMGMLYREDIFKKYGISVPKTWDQFAAAARKLHAANPNVYMTNLAPNDPGALEGLFWQAGSHPFTMKSRTSLSINIDDQGAKRVSDFFTPLIKQGVVSTDPDFTDAWYKGLSSGRYATWLTAAWGPVFMKGVAAPTAGKWRAAPLPQWSSGANVSGNWGGSTTAVLKLSKHPAVAAAFAEFINTDPASTKVMTNDQSLFPVTQARLHSPEFLNAKLSFFGGQQVNAMFANVAKTVSSNFTWSPFQDYVYSSSNDTYGKAMTQKGDLSSALSQWQSAVVAYAKKQGFTVSG